MDSFLHLTQRAIALVPRYAAKVMYIVTPYGALKHSVFGTEGSVGAPYGSLRGERTHILPKQMFKLVSDLTRG